MKFTNSRILSLYMLGYVFLSLFLFSFLIYNYVILNSSFFNITETLILVFSISLIFYYWYNKAKYIHYDSKGLGLVFINKGIFLSKINNYREQRIEIPKNKLKNYRIKNTIFNRKLFLYIKSYNELKKVSFDITFLSKNKIKHLQTSLEKVVQENSSNND